MKISWFWFFFIKVYTLGCDWLEVIIGLVQGLEANMWQAII